MSTDYLHGYDAGERARLLRQARSLAPWVHAALPFDGVRRLLEVGCGVGAQTEILLERFPGVHVTGIDRAAEQLAAARASLAAKEGSTGRYAFEEMDAQALRFPDGAFDAAFLCWVLEHVSDPLAVLVEVRRALASGAVVVCTEVLNTSYFMHPPGPAMAAYWASFNARQEALGGDPFVGAKLVNLLLEAGFREVEVTVKSMVHDDRDPEARQAYAEYFVELLASAAPGLLDAGVVTADAVSAMQAEVRRAGGPGGAFFYAFMQATGRTP